MNSDYTPALKLALVGCGAISESYYAAALREVQQITPIEVVAFFDPSAARLAVLQDLFPQANCFQAFDDLIELQPNLTIVASPPRFHASQTSALLAAGSHVLCEKPMASTIGEAQTMISAARKANRVLSIGLFRRFFPALQVIKALVSDGALGAAQSFHFQEGGPFNWPAASGSFFQRDSSGGGVLLDLGAHVLDLICWWFGEADSIFYEDDEMGNLEANCHISLDYASGLTGVVRLSRDTPCSNVFCIEFERGRVSWKVGDANHLDIKLNGVPFDFYSELQASKSVAYNYHQSFVKQMLNFVSAARGLETVVVSGEEALRSLRLIELCYANKHLIAMPWLTDLETTRAQYLASGLL
jgi:predicted dehydrogenase